MLNSAEIDRSFRVSEMYRDRVRSGQDRTRRTRRDLNMASDILCRAMALRRSVSHGPEKRSQRARFRKHYHTEDQVQHEQDHMIERQRYSMSTLKEE